MPADAKPLFRLDALRAKMSLYSMPSAVASARPKLGNWTDLLASKAAEKMKETELLGDFIRDVFGDLLGYDSPASGKPVYTIKRESLVQVDGKFADAALGRFTLADAQADFVVVIEGKGPRDPLDRPFGSRKRSAVEQALQYAVNLQIDWFLVTNMSETRLYHKGHDLFTYERFETSKLAADDMALKRFAYLLGAERVVPATGGTHLDALLAESHQVGRELTAGYYHEYATLRRQTFHELRRANPDVAPADLLVVAQKILDRVLFIAFCEDRGLLPPESIANASRHQDEYNPRPVWDNFRTLFRWIDQGNPPRIAKYNGGLFAKDELLERLRVPDVVCKGFDKLAAYEYGKDVDNPHAKMIDVEILGHIFEQSISDLEELHQQIAQSSPHAPREDIPHAEREEYTKAGPSKRKKEGAFYTPAFVTRYIVAETLQPILADRFETLRQQYEEDAKPAVKKLFADPRAYDLRELTAPQRKALADFWNAWLDTLATVRIVDPACGSGAFLLEAFDQLHAHYQQANARLRELVNQQLFADVDKQILQSNLFGMDLNTEAIEICRLSLWIKTAEKGKVLTSLDDNVKQGNSVVASPDPLTAWRERFPAAFAEGGFDVVIGNPPYVRQEWIAKDKPFLEQHYKAYDGTADLYVYFYELGMKLLKPGGRLGFISSNSFFKAAYAEALRGLLTTAGRLEQLVDLGDTQIFSDAKDVYPAIAIVSKDFRSKERPLRTLRLRRRDRAELMKEYFEKFAVETPFSHLDPKGWQLDDPATYALRAKMMAAGTPIEQLVSGGIYRGIISGLTDAFVVETAVRDRLAADTKAFEIVKPFVGGQHIRRWFAEDSGNWLIMMPSGWTASKAGTTDIAKARDWLRATYPALSRISRRLKPRRRSGQTKASSGGSCARVIITICSINREDHLSRYRKIGSLPPRYEAALLE
jgi:methylase of polypeptide subunit release factors